MRRSLLQCPVMSHQACSTPGVWLSHQGCTVGEKLARGKSTAVAGPRASEESFPHTPQPPTPICCSTQDSNTHPSGWWHWTRAFCVPTWVIHTATPQARGPLQRVMASISRMNCQITHTAENNTDTTPRLWDPLYARKQHPLCKSYDWYMPSGSNYFSINFSNGEIWRVERSLVLLGETTVTDKANIQN